MDVYKKKGPPVHGPPLWTWSMDLIVDPVHGLPRGPPLIFEDEFLPKV